LIELNIMFVRLNLVEAPAISPKRMKVLPPSYEMVEVIYRTGVEKALIVRDSDAALMRDSNPRFSYKPFWCCFLLLNSGLIFQIFTFVHTGFTRCLHDFFTLEKLCKITKNF
jgi:hypothetical protein